MAEDERTLTAAELDQMSPDERAAALRDRLVTDLDELPKPFRHRVEETARRLAGAAVRRGLTRAASCASHSRSSIVSTSCPPGTAGGEPSSTDFLLHDLPAIIDQLADDFEGATLAVSQAPGVRVISLLRRAWGSGAPPDDAVRSDDAVGSIDQESVAPPRIKSCRTRSRIRVGRAPPRRVSSRLILTQLHRAG